MTTSKILFIGMDVHKDSIEITISDGTIMKCVVAEGSIFGRRSAWLLITESRIKV